MSCSFILPLLTPLPLCFFFFFFNDTATTEIYTLSLHDALPISVAAEPRILPPEGFVTDRADVIPRATRERLVALLEELRQKTGAEIAVVTVPTTAPLDDFTYAMRIADAWKPGRKREDTGIVFLVAVEDRKLRILTGYGLEGTLPDGVVGEIEDREIVPAFRAGRVDEGIWRGVAELAGRIADARGVELSGATSHRVEPPGSAPIVDAIPFVLLVIILIFFSLVLAYGGGPRSMFGRRGGGYLRGLRGGVSGGGCCGRRGGVRRVGGGGLWRGRARQRARAAARHRRTLPRPEGEPAVRASLRRARRHREPDRRRTHALQRGRPRLQLRHQELPDRALRERLRLSAAKVLRGPGGGEEGAEGRLRDAAGDVAVEDAVESGRCT